MANTQSTTAERGRPAAVTAEGYGWRHAGRKDPAVSDVSFRIEPGERVLLLGASGAGKSTLLHAIAGVLGDEGEGDEAGRLTVDGMHPVQSRGRTGLVLQDPESQVVMARVGDEVTFGAENMALPRDEIWSRVRKSLSDVGLEVPLDHPTTALSGGQKQRLALASVLAMRPGVLLLDEPTANLDPDGVLEVRDAVVGVLERTGATLIVVEHRVAIWADVVDRVIVLAADGGVLADGPPAEVLNAAGTRERLIEAGVWVPGYTPRLRTPGPPSGRGNGGSHSTPGTGLLRAAELSVARTRRAGPVVSKVSLELAAGEALSITGPNGAGKSTLALTLAGLLTPAGGRLEAAPELRRGAASTVHKWKSAELVTRIGTVFQEPEHQFLTHRVIDELEFGPRRVARLPEDEVRRRVDAIAERLRLTKLLQANPFTLSGGEKRRLSVATMLATSPDILVLDEPTFGQDANTWAELVSLLGGLIAEGHAVVSVTHDGDFTAALGGNVLRVAEGTAQVQARVASGRAA
ncbi:ABC transporter ATP-binding protein [Arthrobacter crystallopoietes]|uniref:Energy-coupling factor transport system ATP-binding protein n=1 Tax=Crystallibacter crystallopoietes TaxID=37928 RepID=A0A1H1EF46_9MICC|nr:ABC transporter ATP-binding protein [Arthrobacter crystallopoietes]AUI49934.1 ABC transporter ATP-binding protein [Arthrobacter crystallopoietes]SDQ87313.1 energy-coupling factor transport system ATP-binding protein [Arthrobacter crystallopoietes]